MWLFVGWRSRRRQKRRNKMWLWARARREPRKRSPPRRRRPRWSPSWRHSPPPQLVHTRTTRQGNGKQIQLGFQDAGQITCWAESQNSVMLAVSLSLILSFMFKLYLTKYVRLLRFDIHGMHNEYVSVFLYFCSSDHLDWKHKHCVAPSQGKTFFWLTGSLLLSSTWAVQADVFGLKTQEILWNKLALVGKINTVLRFLLTQ